MVGVYGVLMSLLGFANAYFNFFVITKVSRRHCVQFGFNSGN